MDERIRRAVAPLTAADLMGLPRELLDELEIPASQVSEALIMEILKERGGKAHMDLILIGVWKRTGKVWKRNTTISKLFRMAKKGLVQSLTGTAVGLQGVYQLKESHNVATIKLTQD